MNIEGMVISIEEKELTSSHKPTPGTSLTIQTSDGIKKVYFPREMSLSDEYFLLNQRVKYSSSSKYHGMGSSTESFTQYTYELEVLSGTLSGLKVKKSLTG